MEAQMVINQARPMLEDLLPKIGIAKGRTLDLSECVGAFSDWIAVQDVKPDDINFLTSLIGAFIIVFIVEHAQGEAKVKDNRIFVAIPFDYGVCREFEPYGVAHGIASGTSGNVASFLRSVIA